MNEHNNIPTRCSEVVGEALDALTAEVERLEAANAKMREALKKIENSAYGSVGCLRYPCPHFDDDEVTCKHCEYCSITIAREALAEEGGAK